MFRRPNPRLDFDSRVLTEIKIENNPNKRRATPNFCVKLFLKLVDRRSNFFYNYDNESWEIFRTSSFDIYLNEESPWKGVEWAMRVILCLGKDTIQKVLERVQTYIYWNPRPTWLEVSINKVVVNRVELYYWYYNHDVPILLERIKELSLKRISFEDLNRLKEDEEDYCCPICLGDLAEEEDVKVTCILFEICLEYFSKQKDATLMYLPCNHVFHDQCILKWLRISSSCPLCRL